MSENDAAKLVLDCAFSVHRELGPGLFESVYEAALAMELTERRIDFTRQQPLPVYYKGKELEVGFRTDLIVEHCLIVEVKSVETLLPVHSKQLLNYLRITRLKLGLLINFNERLLRSGIQRIANNL